MILVAQDVPSFVLDRTRSEHSSIRGITPVCHSVTESKVQLHNTCLWLHTCPLTFACLCFSVILGYTSQLFLCIASHVTVSSLCVNSQLLLHLQ